MATVKSTLVTNFDANTREPTTRDSGILKEACATATVSASQASGDIVHFVRVPSNARISQILVSHADATTAGAADFGVYSRSVVTGSPVYTVVDADLFASAYVFTAGPVWNFDITNESAEYSEAEQQLMLWEVLGLTSDPGIDYFISATLTTTFNGGPTTIELKARYVE